MPAVVQSAAHDEPLDHAVRKRRRNSRTLAPIDRAREERVLLRLHQASLAAEFLFAKLRRRLRTAHDRAARRCAALEPTAHRVLPSWFIDERPDNRDDFATRERAFRAMCSSEHADPRSSMNRFLLNLRDSNLSRSAIRAALFRPSREFSSAYRCAATGISIQDRAAFDVAYVANR